MVDRRKVSGAGTSPQPKRKPKVAGRTGAPSKAADGTTATSAAPSYSKIAQRRAEREKAGQQAETVVVPAPRPRKPAKKKADASLLSRLRSSLLVLGATVVVALFAALLAWAPWQSESLKNEAFFSGDTAAILRAEVGPTLCAPFQFSYQDVDTWRADATNRMAGQALEEFQAYLDTATQQIVDGQLSSICTITENTFGVVDYRPDRATVISVVEVNQIVGQTPVAAQQPRIEYKLVRQDGKWKVEQVNWLDAAAQ